MIFARLLRAITIFFTGTYDRPVEIALQAADSASGLIIACALVTGSRLSDVSVKPITRKAKEKSFAAGCDRNRIPLIATLREMQCSVNTCLPA
jgi:predicted hydrolase (HD superfamily)